MVEGIEHFRYFLLGKKFTHRTDHKALEYLWSARNQETRLMRWSLKLQEYDFNVEFIKGESNLADGFSRYVRNILKSSKNNKTDLGNDEKERLLENYHLELAHGSIAAMNFAIRSKYNGKNIHKDIENLVNNCEIVICLGRKE